MARKRPQFTDGIFNYCDRWCERCADTARCRLWHDEDRANRRHQRRGEDPADWDVVFQDVSRNFEKVMRMLQRTAKAQGLDLDAIAKEAAAAPPRRDSHKHPLCREADRFLKGSRRLVKRLRPIFEGERRDAIRRAGFMDVAAEAKALARLRNAAEVLAWDGPLVFVKTRRVVDGHFEAAEEAAAGDPDGFHLEDARKTAGLIQRLLKRDKGALLAVYEWDERLERGAIDLLAIYERIRRALAGMFPD